MESTIRGHRAGYRWPRIVSTPLAHAVGVPSAGVPAGSVAAVTVRT